ncbi:NAD+ synthase [Bermanella marisrubri]|uniref:Glutamine-dependent NAD(+) synthetase n=1 Tax=Bermanella marisrubri TaxID=207949 RepID=Q1MYR1_9GAMM|nr:NAD+ synthase [Bermanella marisrubri]EAT11145.1 NAD synthase [Oceanobacter sp. RED65] [Bermanella marisrubri]
MSEQSLSVCLAQLNLVVGDIQSNTQKVLASAKQSVEKGVDVVIFPELTLTGYPPEDLLLRPSLKLRVEQALQEIEEAALPITLVIGYPKVTASGLQNMAGVIENGRLVAEYAKQHLPNFQVFDEKRYFIEGTQPCVVQIKGLPVAISICEDIWQKGIMTQAKQAGAKLMLNLNASPFHIDKPLHREALLKERALEGAMPIVYVNLVGGQDELVFDGGSVVVDQQGNVKSRAITYDEAQPVVELAIDDGAVSSIDGKTEPHREKLDSIYSALVLGTKDYVNKNGFKGVVLGLSGGIDSALTLAVAVDALGKERVQAIMMPFKYTSQMSLHDAEDEANRLGVEYKVMPIEPMFDAFMGTLADEFEGTKVDTTEENLQSRCRGVLLMAMSNKKGSLVLTTGNKSEMAVGYATLYGDMAGGYGVLKDVFKTLVFELSKYRNTLGEVIPPRVISRPPSAELAPDQVDEDSLPAYPVLDEILRLYIEEDQSAQAIIAKGFKEDEVNRVIRLVDINEYKRRQAPVGVRLTQRGFGRDRRYPITNGWRAGI